MPPQQTLGQKVAEFKRDLDTIESQLELIKREYDLFFAGARKRQPFEMKMQIEKLLRKWRATNIQKLELTFRLTSLHSKYSSLTGVWERILKRRETDPSAISPFGPSAQQIADAMARDRVGKQRPDPAELEPEPPTLDADESPLDLAEGLADVMNDAVASVSNAAQTARAARERNAAGIDPEQRTRGLFDQFVDAKKDLGEGVGSLSYDKFKQQLDKQVTQIRNKTQCKDVQFNVVRKDGKVSLKAKPVR